MNEREMKKVNSWLVKNTFHYEEFKEIAELVVLKQQQGKKITVAIPTLNEEKTIGNVVRTIKKELIEECPLIDELIVIDSGSEDNTRLEAEKAGARFVLGDSYSYISESDKRGKGTNLWLSLYLSEGDIISWVDADITNFHARFVYGPIGVLLKNQEVGYVKGFYKRPLQIDSGSGKKDFSKLGGGRVTELCFRHLTNNYFPELAGLIQPLSGEFAGTREILEKIPFYSGYSVETGLLINILEQFGLNSIAQVDLEIRYHKNQDLESLKKMSAAISDTIHREAAKRNRQRIGDSKLYVPSFIMGIPNMREIDIKDIERPPMSQNARYQRKRRQIRR